MANFAQGSRSLSAKNKMAEVHKTSIHGATLAGLLQSVVGLGTPRDCDGLLFGEFKSRVFSRFSDDASEALLVEDHQAHISAAVCSTSTCSFYDTVGELNEARLLEMHASGPEPIIGWLSYRDHTPLQPSMREAAVTSALHARAVRLHDSSAGRGPRPPPTLLMLITSHHDHGGATLTIDFRVLQATCGSLLQPSIRIHPVELVVVNLAQGLGHHTAYQSFQPCSSLGGGQVQQAALEAVEKAAKGQVTALEGHLNGLLSQLQVLCRQVSDSAATAASLQADNDRLLDEIAQLSSEA